MLWRKIDLVIETSGSLASYYDRLAWLMLNLKQSL